MNSKYDHIQVELDKNKKWIEDEVFFVDSNKLKGAQNFSIILPPPNVTGKLHIGHAWDTTLQDLLIRYKKMQGYNAVWIPGMDHAGIATQSKIENLLYEEGVNKHDLGRDKFLEKTWEWKEEYAAHIREQWGKLGLGLDYSKEKFTLDNDANELVNKVFVELYNKDLIYRGYKITNWDPKAKTALSDIEVIHKDIKGNEHYFKYISKDDPNDYLEIMTTRPETMFGDGALAVHPEDTRYNHLEGKEYIIPNTSIVIPVILDEYVDQEKGSGVVKITMAHDPNDFEVANRHRLEPRIIMDEDGKMSKNEYVPEAFWGIDRFEARKKQVQLARENGLLIKIEEIEHSVGHSERSGAVVEPLLSRQWYVKMESLAKRALENQKTENKVDFYPQRFENTFNTWMENIQDWCISRQLWWGHRIPAWYKEDEVYVGVIPPEGHGWEQDEDVLDTWFSSALWPMVTSNFLNEDQTMMENLYPHSTLVSGYDIIFFWISRMIFQSLEFTNKRPFDNVLVHGLIRDSEGRKMSKSLGNGVDPMDVIEQFGADSLRYFLTTNSTPGQDLRYSEEKLTSTWNFLNKLWNISRYVLSNTEDVIHKFNNEFDYDSEIENFDKLTSADNYILDKLNKTIEYIETMMEKYEFTEVGAKIYNFIWDDFASWYLETSKVVLSGEDESNIYQTKIILLKVLIDSLKMLHPFVPFITEEIYSSINPGIYLVNQNYPKIIKRDLDSKEYESIKEIIVSIRNFKSSQNIKPSKVVEIYFERIDEGYFEQTSMNILKNFGKISDISYKQREVEVYTEVFKDFTINICLEGLIDKEETVKKLLEQSLKLQNEILRSYKMLTNEKFVNNANVDKLNSEKDKAKKYIEQIKEVNELLEKENKEVNKEVNIEEFEEILKRI